MSSGDLCLLPIVRFGFGIGLLAQPAWLLRVAGRRRPDARAVVVARILGGRQLLESIVLLAWPRAVVACVGAGVDTIHAGTAAVVATVTPRDRRLALANVVSAALLAILALNEPER